MPVPSHSPAPRGRPRSITRERIADAGIALGLPHITFTGLAAELGVSHMALYKHVPNLEALKCLVAEEIFGRWEIPQVDGSGQTTLADYLEHFVTSLRALVRANPGLAPWLLRRSATTQPMLAKIDHHHRAVAQAWGLSQTQARWMLTTVAFHCIAVADTVYSVQACGCAAEENEIEQECTKGLHALITGTLALVKTM
ncbi:TetR family transcriptional regulator [Cephaloticoccus primus]|uniref:TetR family transcriptional regulator n=1 Tax=Cephaloticoccus primus TaxID=1548207 RepID=A0A139SPR1_9BACT|nr:TetR/AcrR family transcriptional regulator [Cephaloticoccus primus]KXU36523.1 TetR family transcriptional regulator [Cephaloticoccus primus]